MRAVHYFGKMYRWNIDDVRKLSWKQVTELQAIAQDEAMMQELERKRNGRRRN